MVQKKGSQRRGVICVKIFRKDISFAVGEVGRA